MYVKNNTYIGGNSLQDPTLLPFKSRNIKSVDIEGHAVLIRSSLECFLF